MFESLEARKMLAAGPTIGVSGGVLTVIGTKDNDRINVVEDGGTVVVEVTYGKNASQFLTPPPFTGITAIKISGGNGDDVITYTGNTIGADIHGDANASGGSHGGSGGSGGGKGDDFITVSDNGTGASTLNGDNGDDDLVVLQGNTTGLSTVVFGGKGN